VCEGDEVLVLLLIVSNADVGAGCQVAVGACKAGLSDVLADATCWLSALFFTYVVTLHLKVSGHFGSDVKFLFLK
jgi:preprotein translocase subunit SecG